MSNRERGERPGTRDRTERQVIDLVRAEFREMPGLKLTAEQASRLWHVERRVCESVLRKLTDERLLRRTRDGAFVRAD